mmetsp:Transcript_30367/g.102488  ORF Transcript_30367/g.102488 Transcript_30367/m.102488 type:complete len:201 (-) Transcript_30367:280-882(-)
MAPSASAASCRTIGCSKRSSSATVKAGSETSRASWPRTKAISWRSRSLERRAVGSTSAAESTSVASSSPMSRSANMALYRSQSCGSGSPSSPSSTALRMPMSRVFIGGVGSTDLNSFLPRTVVPSSALRQETSWTERRHVSETSRRSSSQCFTSVSMARASPMAPRASAASWRTMASSETSLTMAQSSSTASAWPNCPRT